VYLSEWSWQNAQCTCKNRLGEKVPDSRLKGESESDPLDVACHDAVIMMLDVISESDMHFQLDQP